MHLSLINTIDDFNSISAEWNDLLSCCSASHVPFLRSEYQRIWWSTLGGGEWKSGELHIVTARQENGELVGIAPLFTSTDQAGRGVLTLIGSQEISDYLDFIVSPSQVDEFTESLLGYLQAESPRRWERLELVNLLEDSPTLDACLNAANKHNWSYHLEVLQPCPFIPLPGGWETYLGQIDKKQRHEIRRKLRRLESLEQPARWYIVDDPVRLEDEISALFNLMATDPQKERFLTRPMRQQLRSCMQTAFEGGWLQLCFLEVGGQKAAAYINFDYAGHIWVYNSGFDPQFRDLSPGWVLLAELLKWSNENQRLAFDFMRGGEAYKYRFGAVDRHVVGLRLAPASTRPQAT